MEFEFLWTEEGKSVRQILDWERRFDNMQQHTGGLGWAGLGWAGLGWAGLGWILTWILGS
jgi:hypothetical protein